MFCEKVQLLSFSMRAAVESVCKYINISETAVVGLDPEVYILYCLTTKYFSVKTEDLLLLDSLRDHGTAVVLVQTRF